LLGNEDGLGGLPRSVRAPGSPALPSESGSTVVLLRACDVAITKL